MGIISAIKGWWNRMFKSEAENLFGTTITASTMEAAISDWLSIYQGKPDWVDPEDDVKTINFASTVCEETARLTTLDIGVQFDGRRAEYMQNWSDRAVMPKLREWLEYGMALGTVIMKPNGTGVDMVTPGNFEITDKDGMHNISGITFQDRYQSGGNWYTKLEHHKFQKMKVRYPDSEEYQEVTFYNIQNRVFISSNEGELGKPCTLGETKWSNLQEEVNITKKNGDCLNGMLFGVFRVPSANKIDVNSPLGMSIFSGAIEEMKDLDVCYSRKAFEIYHSKKIVFMDDRLTMLPATMNEKGERVQRSIKLPSYVKNVSGSDAENYYQEVNPQLNVDERIKDINNQLSFVGYKCGYSEGYFVFDSKTGMVTATQVESDDRRTIQLIKDIRDALQVCLNDLYYAQSVFADLYNLAPVGDYEPSYSFGDITYNYEEDKQMWWKYVTAGKVPAWKYFVKFEKMSEDEAKAMQAELEEKEKAQQGLFEEE